MKNIKRSILAIALLSVSSFPTLSMKSEDDENLSSQTTPLNNKVESNILVEESNSSNNNISEVIPNVLVMAVDPLDQPTQHPGGLFKQDQISKHWMVQCQAVGCGSWLNSTRTPYEPSEKIMKPTDPQMTRFHMLTCKGKSHYTTED